MPFFRSCSLAISFSICLSYLSLFGEGGGVIGRKKCEVILLSALLLFVKEMVGRE